MIPISSLNINRKGVDWMLYQPIKRNQYESGEHLYHYDAISMSRTLTMLGC